MDLTTGHVAADLRPSVRPSNGLRWIWALSLVALTVLLVVKQFVVRSAEARLLALWAGPMFPRGFMSEGPAFLIVGTPEGSVLFRITVECTALVLIVPMMVLLAFIGLHRGARLSRLLVALVAATVSMTIVNQLRLLLIGWATYNWGLNPGYTITHVFLGSLLALVGFGLSAILAIKILGINTKARKVAR